MNETLNRSLGLQHVYEVSAIAAHEQFKHYYEVCGELEKWAEKKASLVKKEQDTRKAIEEYGRHAPLTRKFQ